MWRCERSKRSRILCVIPLYFIYCNFPSSISYPSMKLLTVILATAFAVSSSGRLWAGVSFVRCYSYYSSRLTCPLFFLIAFLIWITSWLGLLQHHQHCHCHWSHHNCRWCRHHVGWSWIPPSCGESCLQQLVALRWRSSSSRQQSFLWLFQSSRRL